MSYKDKSQITAVMSQAPTGHLKLPVWWRHDPGNCCYVFTWNTMSEQDKIQKTVALCFALNGHLKLDVRCGQEPGN